METKTPEKIIQNSQSTFRTDEKQQRKIALLFLAHKGISQPQIWKMWRDEFSQGKNILFFGIMSKPQEGWIQIQPKYKSQWCDKSLVYLEQQGLQFVLDYDPQIQQIYLVSGDSIPIREAKYVFHLPDKTRYPLSRGLSPSRLMRERVGSQWRGYDRKTAEKIATFDFDHNSEFQDLLKKTEATIDQNTLEKQKLFYARMKDIVQRKREGLLMQEKKDPALLNYYEYLYEIIKRQEIMIKDKFLVPSACADESWIPCLFQVK